MKMKEKEVTLKDGGKIHVKSVGEGEEKQLLEFLKKVSGETSYLPFTAKELDADKIKNKIAEFEKGKKRIMLAAYQEKSIVAYCTICEYSEWESESHRAVISVAVLKDMWNKGIGSQLLSTVIDFATKVKFDQIESYTEGDNVNALLLYGKFGINPEGKIPCALKINDSFIDCIYFIKKLSQEK